MPYPPARRTSTIGLILSPILVPETTAEIEWFHKYCAFRVKRISPRNTVPTNKNGSAPNADQYRTGQQRIPYPPTRNTVPASKPPSFWDRPTQLRDHR